MPTISHTIDFIFNESKRFVLDRSIRFLRRRRSRLSEFAKKEKIPFFRFFSPKQRRNSPFNEISSRSLHRFLRPSFSWVTRAFFVAWCVFRPLFEIFCSWKFCSGTNRILFLASNNVSLLTLLLLSSTPGFTLDFVIRLWGKFLALKKKILKSDSAILSS